MNIFISPVGPAYMAAQTRTVHNTAV